MTTDQLPAIETFADAQAALAASLPGYTRRERQEKLAAAIESAVSGERHLLAQAGTGIGKSLAALIPAILSRRRVVIATSTKALQEQYTAKDLPFLSEHLGVPFTWAKIKGRSNYPCAAKISTLSTPTPGQLAAIRALPGGNLTLDPQVPAIDRDDLPPVKDTEWGNLSMSAAECPGKKNCPFAEGRKCHAELAKAQAQEAQIVITNTAYLMQDIRLRQLSGGAVNLLGEFDLLIVDEAHNLESAVTSALSDSLGENAFLRLASDAEGYLSMETGDMDANFGKDVHQATETLWDLLRDSYRQFIKANDSKQNPMPLYQAEIIRKMSDEFVALWEALTALHDQVKASRPEDERGKLARYRLMRRISDWAGRIRLITITPDTEICKWLEQEEITSRGTRTVRLMLRSAPVTVGPFLRENLWDTVPVIMMSATLAVGHNFGYITECLGLEDGEALTFDAGSPFDYKRQARLYVPEASVPAPTGPTAAAWKSWAQEATRHLVEQAKGGALLLFTSRTAMNDAHRRLAPVFSAAGLTVLKQDDARAPQLVAQFKQDGNAVLFGLKTFFEGIDIQGDSLRLVVLDKLPFAVPTDILFQARAERVDKLAGRRVSFYKLSVPEMSLVLIQAFGRLIRHAGDKGVVAILDSRLTSKSYGARILESLPPAPVTVNIREAAAFLAQ